MRDLEANHRDVTQLYHELAGRYCGLLMFYDVMPDGCWAFLNDAQ